MLAVICIGFVIVFVIGGLVFMIAYDRHVSDFEGDNPDR